MFTQDPFENIDPFELIMQDSLKVCELENVPKNITKVV